MCDPIVTHGPYLSALEIWGFTSTDASLSADCPRFFYVHRYHYCLPCGVPAVDWCCRCELFGAVVWSTVISRDCQSVKVCFLCIGVKENLGH